MEKLIFEDLAKIKNTINSTQVGVFGSSIYENHPNDIDVFLKTKDLNKTEVILKNMELNFPSIRIDKNKYNNSKNDIFGYHFVLSNSLEFNDHMESVNSITYL